MPTVDEDDIETIWKPEHSGDQLSGTVFEMKLLTSKFGGGQYPFLGLKTADGSIVGWHAAQTVAKSQLKQVRAQVGDTLTIRYKGEHKNGYKDFAIKSDRNVEFDWNA